jgi:hypothetical protein
MLADPHVRAFIALLVLLTSSLLMVRWLLKGTTLYESFERRRNYWVIALIISFAVTNFYVAMVLLGAVFFWAAKKDPRPVSIYLMFLLAVPPAYREIEGFGPINQLFSLNAMRLLSLTVLLPLALQMIFRPDPKTKARNLSPWFTDVVVGLLALFILACHTPYETETQLMRRAFHLTVDMLLPYFVISRHVRDRAAVKDALGALFVCGLIVAPIAIFEHFKGWLLYETVYLNWQEVGFSIFLMRDTSLRAMVTSGHALVLGHFMVVCIGLLGIFRFELKGLRLVVVWGLLLLALYSTVSRGPWVGAVIVILAMGLFTGKVLRFYGLASLSAALGITALLFSPWRDKVISYMPFIGSVDSSNVDYRQMLADTTWRLVQQRPWFGSVKTLLDMEHLRQGQGIIDLVNVYADYALHYGLIGAGLFVLFLSSGLLYGLLISLRSRKKDREMFFMAGNTAVALFGSMVLLVGVSDFQSIPRVYTALVALLVVMARLHHRPRSRLSAIQPSSGTQVALRTQ